jgi:hypothetical protein
MHQLLNMRNEKGQSLVEMAFVLLPFLVCLFVIIRILVFSLNQLVMQRMAQVSANQVSTGTPAGTKNYSMYNSLWGSHEDVQWNSTRDPLYTWTPYAGYETISLPARLMKIDLQVQSISGPLTQELAQIANHSSAIVLIMPPIPGDRS